MRQKTKLTITALVVLLFMALAVTVISFSFADDADSESSETQVVESESLTNIDYIIRNSNDETLTDSNRKYRIVEIGSGTQSSLAGYASGDVTGFETYVLEGNKTISDAFASGNVSYHYFNAKDVTKTSTTYSNEKDEDGNAITDFAIISQADMIYISNGASPGYKTGNDISEDLFSLIQPKLIGDYIPVIIDMPSKSGSNGSGGTAAATYTMGNALGDYFDAEGRYYYTFRYKSGDSASTFLDTSLSSTSEYLSINAKTQNKNGKYETVQDGSSTGSMGKVLVVSKSGNAYTTDGTIVKALLGDASVKDGLNYPATEDGEEAVAVTGTVLDISNSTFRSAYNSTYGNIPTYIQLEDISVSGLADKNLDDYDMVIIESDVKSESISEDVYKQLGSAMYGKVHITYAESAIVKASTSSSSSSTEASGTNYEKMYNLLSKSDVAAYQNVMITDKSKFDLITSSNSAATAKSIADLINASSYRGIGGPGSAASTFTVLEIQPCYPIDTELASKNNKYYSDPDGVVNGLSKEEIEATTGETDTEYYAWELSKAKIADSLGMDVSNITLTQMSTEEFSSNKDEILGKYDLVYIGGNTSAIKDITKYYSWTRLYGEGKDQYLNLSDEKIKEAPIYRTYSHNGDMTGLSTISIMIADKSGGTAALKTVTVKDGGSSSTKTYSNAATMLNGNDISSVNLEYLKDYVDAGMPIVFSDVLTSDYQAVVDFGYKQNSIDPDSNMYNFLKYCMNKEDATNILSGFDPSNSDTLVSSDGENGSLSMYASKVYVLKDEAKASLKSLYLTSTKKPKLVLTSSPAIYSLFDTSTIIKDTNLTFAVNTAALGNASAKNISLYIDDDGNSKFTSDEKFETTVDESGDTVTLSAELPDTYNGPVYWKVEAVDGDNKVFVTGLSYVQVDSSSKSLVSVLQIMPDTRVVGGTASGSEGATGANTLYFCVDCQQGYKNLYYNPNSANNYGTYDYYYGDNGGFRDTEKTGYASGIKMGLHEHHFGIVSYDSTKSLDGTYGVDDWYYNLTDDIKDKYDFDIDIMYVSEFSNYSKEIAQLYNGLTEEEAKTKAAEFSNQYSEMLEKYNDQKEIVESAQIALEAMMDEVAKNAGNYNVGAAFGNMSVAERQEIANNVKKRESYSEFLLAEGFADTSRKSGSFAIYRVGDNFYVSEDKMNQAKAQVQALLDNTTDADKKADLQSELNEYANPTVYTSFKEIYEAWATEHDKMLIYKGGYYVNDYTYQYLSDEDKTKYAAYNQYYSDGGIEESVRILGYKDYQKYANYGDWLAKTYTSVIIGASDGFAGSDITDSYALAAIKTFVQNEGQLVLFHDTLSAYSDRGAVELTKLLRPLAGVDKYHLVADMANVTTQTYTMSGDQSVEVSWDGKTVSSSINLNDWKSGPYKNISLTANYGQYYSWYDKSYSGGLYDTSSVTLADGKTESSEKITFAVTCKDEGNLVKNTSVTVTVGGFETTVQTDGNGVATVTVPVKYEASVLSNNPTYSTSDSATYPDSIYFMTNPQYDKIASTTGSTPTYAFVPGGYTDLITSNDYNASVDSYKYADIHWSEMNTVDAKTAHFSSAAHSGTDRAKKNNNAIVTQYPYQLADEICISGTHPQAYATDVDDEDMTVLYSFTGGTDGNSAIFAADPSDGTDNYFMYAYKSVFYCGAGHSKVTGVKRDNLNERYLYLNIICNSVKPSVKGPSIKVYDVDSTEKNLKNNVVQEDGSNGYVYSIDEDTEYPEFSFKATVDSDSETTLKKVEIYYDLDYIDQTVDVVDENGEYVLNADESRKQTVIEKADGYNDKTDVLIASWGPSGLKNQTFAAGVLGFIKSNDTETLETYSDNGTITSYLKLKDEYFAPYGGKYTYIVIKVTDSNDNVRYQRIKITLKDKLFNLT